MHKNVGGRAAGHPPARSALGRSAKHGPGRRHCSAHPGPCPETPTDCPSVEVAIRAGAPRSAAAEPRGNPRPLTTASSSTCRGRKRRRCPSPGHSTAAPSYGHALPLGGAGRVGSVRTAGAGPAARVGGRRFAEERPSVSTHLSGPARLRLPDGSATSGGERSRKALRGCGRCGLPKSGASSKTGARRADVEKRRANG